MKEKEIKKKVREGYADIVKKKNSCYTPVSSCCGYANKAEDISKDMGYTEEELKSVPDGANLGLGCGNPIALAHPYNKVKPSLILALVLVSIVSLQRTKLGGRGKLSAWI